MYRKAIEMNERDGFVMWDQRDKYKHKFVQRDNEDGPSDDDCSSISSSTSSDDSDESSSEYDQDSNVTSNDDSDDSRDDVLEIKDTKQDFIAVE